MAGEKLSSMESLFKRDFLQIFGGMDGYFLLAFAIVNQAVEDYREAIRKKDVDTITEIEDFLRTEYAETICNKYNWTVLNRLKEERHSAWSPGKEIGGVVSNGL